MRIGGNLTHKTRVNNSEIRVKNRIINDNLKLNPPNISNYYYLYLLFILSSLIIFSSIISDVNFLNFEYYHNQNYFYRNYISYKTIFVQSHCINLVKYFSVIIIASLVSKFVFHGRSYNPTVYDKIIRAISCNMISTKYRHMSRLTRLLFGLMLWMLLINYLLVAIVNPSLLNPGPIKDTNLSVLHLNVQGLIPFGELKNENPLLHNRKLYELNEHIEYKKPDIIIYNETWLKPSISDSEIINTDNYKIFRVDRSNYTHSLKEFGGGVLIGIRRDLDIISKIVPVKCKAEILSIELTDGHGRVSIITTFYRVGQLGAENFDRVDKYLRTIRKRRRVDEFIIIGDINMPKTDWDTLTSTDNIEQAFVDTFNDLSLTQLIHEPTHSKGNILDYILTDKPGNISQIIINNDSTLGGLNDHFPIMFLFKFNSGYKKKPKRKIYNFKKTNFVDLQRDFNNTDWDYLFVGKNIDDALKAFHSRYFEVVNKHVPSIVIKDDYQPPWYDSEVHELGKRKLWLHKRWKRTNIDLHYLKFSECRKDFKNLVEKKLEDNFMDKENRNHITKKFWSYVKSKTKSHRIPETVSYGSRFRSNSVDQANLFNEYFSDQFSAPSNYNISINYNNVHSSDDIILNVELTKHYLKAINPNKAQGPDSINGRILKTCSSSLAYPLTYLFRLSYESEKIPHDWKTANVVPVHKKCSKSEVTNYRPISLTSLIMKVYERIIRDELLKRCNHKIDQRQHGFLARKSCCTQMVDFCDSLALSLNDNIRSDIIYFDFQKAFDSVNHDIILNKLKYQYNIDGKFLSFFVDYLKDRSQRVVINTERSSLLNVNSGVPQGSILGPTIFILFLNDITDGLSEGTNITMYADDTKLWRRINKDDDHYVLQKDINLLLDWSTKNMMIFHPDKCKTLSITTGHKPHIDFNYLIADKVIDYTDIEKDLGIYINSKLNWNEHCNKLLSKANQKLGLLKRSCSFINNKSKRRSLYLAMVRSQFEHCPIIWRPSAISTVTKFEALQKRSMKWIINDDYISLSRNYHYFKLCKQLNILPMAFRFDYRDIMFFHSVFYSYSVNSLPSYLQIFSGSRLRHSHYDNLSLICTVIPRTPQNLNSVNSNLGISKSFYYRSHLMWNELPYELRNIGAPSKFKIALLNYLWEKVNLAIKDDFSDDGFTV